MSSKIIAEKKEIKSIFSDFWFLIPTYQRSYVWDTDNIQDLLDDLWYAYEYKRDNEYFLGSIVLKKTEEKEFNEYEVLDGQQRLTTFFLLMAVLRDISVNKDLKDVCQKRIYQKANPYEGIPERIRIIYEIRDNVGGFIKEYILKNEGTLSPKIEEFIKSNNTSISHMANAIKEIKSFFSDKDNKEIEEFAVFLGLKLVFIYVSTESREDAFRMFTILNNRGIPLTSADILKSTNIGEIANQKDQEKYAEKWEEIEGDLGKDFDRFLSFIRTIIVKEKARLSLLDEFGGENLGKLLSKDNYEQIFSKLGINADSEVLVYGFTMPEQGFGDEARVVYTFNYAGFDNVKFIDGGFKQVEKLGFNKNYEPASDRIDVSDVVRSEATQNEKAIFTDELLSKLGNADVQILDTRLEVEYNGRVIYGENKAGHIPGAISLPFNSLVNEEGFVKSREELEKYVNEKGLDKNKLQITYCTTGVRASYVAVILEELGFKVRNYEPSFARYANVGEVE